MRRLTLIVPLIVALTGCDKLIHPIMSGQVSLGDHAGTGSRAPRLTQDLKLVVWGQSNMNNAIVPQAICNALTTGTCEIHNFAVSNTNSFYWVSPTNHQALINDVAYFQPDFVLCAQGEADSYTSRDDYFHNMTTVWEKIKLAAPRAYRGISFNSNVSKGNPRDAQRDLISSGMVHEGVDMDSYRNAHCSPPDPYINPHFIDECKAEIGAAWGQIILNSL